jgi:amidase
MRVLRFGLAFLGHMFTEAKLIGFAYAYEQKTKTRDKVQPYIVPNFELGDFAGF